MDFIERLLGLAPDGGSGWLEWALLLVPIMSLAFLRLRKSLASPAARACAPRH